MAVKTAGLLVLSEANVANVLDKLSTEEIVSTVSLLIFEHVLMLRISPSVKSFLYV